MCNNCAQVQHQWEELYCHSAQFDLLRGEEGCITLKRGFILNCTEIEVVRTSAYDFIDDWGPLGEDEPKHRIYRHIAYHRFIRWVFGLLKKKDRRMLPSYVLAKIRKTFPSQVYTGLKYPDFESESTYQRLDVASPSETNYQRVDVASTSESTYQRLDVASTNESTYRKFDSASTSENTYQGLDAASANESQLASTKAGKTSNISTQNSQLCHNSRSKICGPREVSDRFKATQVFG
ncbi:P2x purinoceptor 7 [Plakobranchus ocellatus]|uniref:P2x purinoceptor 7 n=1 Tax=Plakobranchus ocellatus TaxID=259542 RepID=A0AAV4BWT7_9GAST|nr:P2x purinoceptor 7 [Plakobranchus ocellatus]